MSALTLSVVCVTCFGFSGRQNAFWLTQSLPERLLCHKLNETITDTATTSRAVAKDVHSCCELGDLVV